MLYRAEQEDFPLDNLILKPKGLPWQGEVNFLFCPLDHNKLIIKFLQIMHISPGST